MKFKILALTLLFLTQVFIPIYGAHSGQIDSPTNKQNIAINKIIDKWNHWGAVGTNSKTLFRHGEARLDLQGTENQSDKVFERYAVQMGKQTFNVVHIQVNIKFGIGLIRSAFENPRNTKSHVFLSDAQLQQINVPDDDKKYVTGVINRKWNGQPNQIKIWSTERVVNAMVKKFNQ